MTLLETKQLTKHFGGVAAVQKLDFRLEAGEMRAVIGPNGAGKTTLLRLIMGELRPSSGQILLNEERIEAWPSHKIARAGIAKAFQIPQIFPALTTYQNIQAAVSNGSARLWHSKARQLEIQSQSELVLEQIGLTPEAQVPAAELGHGRQKRLEIGLALGQSPQLLLLDEPTAGLNRAETEEIIQLIRSLQGQTTLIMVEHDMYAVMTLASSISVLHFGQMLAQGTPAEIRDNPKVREVYLTQQALKGIES